MTRFDKLLGKDQIAAFHINDSKNVPGAAKDRHANFGFGEIGFDALMQFISCPDFEEVPKILETPYLTDPEDKTKSYAPYKFEIEMLRRNAFDPCMREKILKAKIIGGRIGLLFLIFLIFLFSDIFFSRKQSFP